MKRAAKRLAECMKCCYPVQICECEEGGYFVKIPDLPGCMSQGETVQEALANIKEAKELWLEGALECGMDIPKPHGAGRSLDEVTLKIPVSLRRRLSRAARQEGLSLGRYIIHCLSLSADGAPKNRRPSTASSAGTGSVRTSTRRTG